MPIDYRQEAPQLLLDFLSYHETIKAHSQRTVDEYFLDLRNFFRYLKQTRDPALRDVPMDQVSIRDVDRDLIASVTLTDIYGYMTYLSRDRVLHQNSQRSERDSTPPPVPESWPPFAPFTAISATRSMCWRRIP